MSQFHKTNLFILKKILLTIGLVVIYTSASSQIMTVGNRYVGCTPDTLKFFTLGNTHSGQVWNSGNGNTSNLDTPVFLYSLAGTYQISIGNLTRTITILPKLNFNFTTDSIKTGCFPFKFNLKDNTSYPSGISPTGISWVYQNGGSKIGNPIQDSISNYYLYGCFVKMIVTTNVPSCKGEEKKDSFFKILDIPKAKIQMSPDSSCRVPFSPSFINKSKDSLRTKLTYFWTWNTPTAGSSTDSAIPPITYTSNTNALITLEAKNIYGCKTSDTARFKIDTPTISVNYSHKICSKYGGGFTIQDYDTANYIYFFSSQKRTNGMPIFTLTNPSTPIDSILKKSRTFNGFDGDYPNENVVRKIYITKISKRDTSCKTTATLDVLICQTFPRFNVRPSRVCMPPFIDSVRVTNWPGNESCWDSIAYSIVYIDKYNVRIRRDSFNVSKSYSENKKGGDTLFYYGLDSFHKVDSFYRRGPLGISVSVSYFSKTDTFNCEHSSDGGGIQSYIIRPHLVNYYNRACLSQDDTFIVYSTPENILDSVTWVFGDGIVEKGRDTVKSHKYVLPGTYRVYAIFKSKRGCIDTTNSVYVYRGDSIIPQLVISKKNLCITDSTTISIANSSSFDQWTFLADGYKSNSCPNIPTYTWSRFYNAGWQYIYILGEKNGCRTNVKDSVYVDGPKFNLNYDFKCSRRFNFRFFLTDTLGIRSNFQWNFGDGNSTSGTSDTIWHNYTGDSINYWVKVNVNNPSGCTYQDSTLVKIRNVKALYSDTLFCKKLFPNTFLNNTPYKVNPLASRNADYLCGYRYSWLISRVNSNQIVHSPVTEDVPVSINLPFDTVKLSLIARDANGCEDTFTRNVFLSDNIVNFKLDYSDSCPPIRIIKCINLSTSPWGFISADWRIYKVKKGKDSIIDSAISYHTDFVADSALADTFKVVLEMKDSAFCAIKSIVKYFIFVKDTSKFYIPDSICHQTTPDNMYSNESNHNLYSYQWYVNNNLCLNDTFAKIKYHQFNQLGINYVRLEKYHKFKGCTFKFYDSTEVKPRPRIRIDNTFDTIKNKCFPVITTIDFYDSSLIYSLYFKFIHNGSPRIEKPTTIALDQGINIISAVFTTGYGCYDSLINYDTVIDPKADLIADKYAICKGDNIRFSLINTFDVDSVFWSFGDGTIYFDTAKNVTHTYNTANINSDTIPISFIVYGPHRACPYSKIDTILVYETKSGHYLNNRTDTAYCLAPVYIYKFNNKADYSIWHFGNADTLRSNQDTIKYSYSQSGKYRIKQYAYRLPLGCVDSSSSNLELFPIPKISAQADSVCLGDTLKIYYQDTLANVKILLSPDTFQKSPYTASPILTKISKTTNFQLISISDKGCVDSTKVLSNVLFPISEKSWDTIVAMGSKIEIPVGYDPTWQYVWQPSLPNPSCINCSSPEIQVFDSIVYLMSIKNHRNCFPQTYKYTIRMYPDIVVKVPRAFTPNGDGNNDILYARGFGIKKLLTLKIFNRQGQLLFLSQNEQDGWDGTYKGVPQNSEVYYYTFEAESYIPNKIVTGDGNFLLLR